jgi:two-component system, cell cycle response regulator DivK
MAAALGIPNDPGMTTDPAPVVLAVEDEPRNAALLQAIIRPPAFELHIVSSLAAARRWLRLCEPSIVLLDRHLPDGDGLDLVAEIRSRAGTRRCPVVLVSASALPGDRIAADVAGCDAFIAKPIRIRALLDEIERQVARAG